MSRPKSSRKRILSEYGIQLQEKQKAKIDYGLRERQMKKYFSTAAKTRGNTAERLLRILESRLDNVVYRLGLSQSRRQARQLVSHRHVFVNGKVVNIPSFQVSPKDKIQLNLKNIKVESEGEVPSWLSLDKKDNAGQVQREPELPDIITDLDIEKIIGYYSR